MLIRKAKFTDSPIIIEHIFLAMEDIIYEFIGMKDSEKAKAFLHHFVEKENNQYSYTNCYVAEIENEIVGTINIYDGAELETLRQPIVQYIRKHYNVDFSPENETEKGEWYIDTIGVNPMYQGQGIGTKLLKFVIEKYAINNQQTLGLLVDKPKAEKLYLSLGFEYIKKKLLAGKQMKHLQLNPNIKSIKH